jgi:hypothetical protein
MKPVLGPADFARAATALGVVPSAVKAVCIVEAPNGGFDPADQPRILFEGHIFHRLTGGRFDKSHPTLSFPSWTSANYAKGADADVRNAREHARLATATSLARSAALMSASWGKFQILGENYLAAGHDSLQSFINAMYDGEPEHLDAFVSFVQKDRGGKVWSALKLAVKTGNWIPFAELYNGPAQAKHQYSSRLAIAFQNG